jgi:glycosyltransferase involved in cell wall biosynthesis
VPPDKIIAFKWFGMQYAWRRSRCKTPSDIKRCFLWANRTFCQKVCRSDWGAANAVFTFNGAGLEILERARRDGLRTVMEQTIAPNAVERRLLAEERERHPGWEPAVEDQYTEAYGQREQAEWPLADLILCGSEFVRQGIAECGGPVERCVVVPYGVELPEDRGQTDAAPPSALPGRSSSSSVPTLSTFNFQLSSLNRKPLRVLTVGGVSLRKGSPYVLEAARRLKGVAEFRMVGPVHVLLEAQEKLREHVELVGPVPRSEVAKHYAWADVFLLPSICEGSATVTYEAQAAGLPVICTPNTGSVVRDGVDGHIIPIRDVDQIVVCLENLAQDADLRARLCAQALENARQNDFQAYGQRLLAALNSLSS